MFVGIVCPNYSGSTVVGGILHRFDGVQHVGEIWKIFVERQRAKAFCFECRPKECVYFSEDFLDELRACKPQSVIFKLNERFSSKVIVSGDKGPDYFLKYDVVPDKALILVKNKYSAAFSYAKRIPNWEDASDEERVELIVQGTAEYFNKWMERVNWVQNNFSTDDYVFASPDVLSEADDNVLQELSLCLFGEKFHIRYNPFDEKFHYIGGNHKLSKGNDPSFFKGEFRADERYMAQFSEKMYDAVDSWVSENLAIPSVNESNKVFLEDWFKSSM